MDFARAYDAVAAFLEARRFPLALVGGLGLHAYGITRATFDLDLLTTTAARDGLIAFLEKSGYETIHRSDGFSNHLHPDLAKGRLDFIYVDEETGRKLFPGCRARMDLGSRRALVPRPEHLVAMKVQAMKNDPKRALQDMADVLALLRRPDIDRQEVRGYFERAGLKEDYDALQRQL